jgi:hypothetical protein
MAMAEDYIRLAKQFSEIADQFAKTQDPMQRRALLVMLRSVVDESDRLSYADLEKLPGQPHDS